MISKNCPSCNKEMSILGTARICSSDDHYICFSSEPHSVTSEAEIIVLKVNNLYFHFCEKAKIIKLYKSDGGYISNSINYFVPDIKNYSKLINKLKTYLLFI